MYGSNIGSLAVDIFHNGQWINNAASVSGQTQTSQADAYTKSTVDLSSYSGDIKVRFRAVASGGWKGDIAIDDIEIWGVTP